MISLWYFDFHQNTLKKFYQLYFYKYLYFNKISHKISLRLIINIYSTLNLIIYPKSQMTSFSLLPIEINSEILSWLSFADLCKMSLISPFDVIIDYSFWKRLAKNDFGTSSNYFDLGLKRGIQGNYRYLEILSKYRPTVDSVANIENRQVTGIYESSALLVKGIIRNYQDLVKHGVDKMGKHEAEKLIREVQVRTQHEVWYEPMFESIFAGLSSISNFPNQMITGEFCCYCPLFVWINEDKWTEIRNFINIKLTQVLSYNLLPIIFSRLIYNRKTEARKIVIENLSSVNEDGLDYCLRSSLNVGDEELFDTISSLLPGLRNNVLFWKLEKYDQGGGYHRRSQRCPYIIDAIIGTNPKLIQRILGLGDEINPERLFDGLTIGYDLGFADPVQAYYLVEKYQGNRFFVPPPDVDIWHLILENPKVKWYRKPDKMFKFCLRQIFKGTALCDHSDPGNVDLLNLFLMKFVSVPGAAKVMREFKIPKYYPLCKQIFDSYSKIASP